MSDIVSGVRYDKLNFLTFIDKTLITNPRFFKKIYDGVAYVSSKRFEGVADGTSVDILFENPNNSGKIVYIITVEVETFGQVWVDIYRNNTVTASGTSMPTFNLNVEKSASPTVKIEYGGTYTTGDLALNTVVPGGKRGRAVGSLAEIGESIIVPPNNNFLVRITNKAGASTDFSIRFVWWEEEIEE